MSARVPRTTRRLARPCRCLVAYRAGVVRRILVGDDAEPLVEVRTDRRD